MKRIHVPERGNEAVFPRPQFEDQASAVDGTRGPACGHPNPNEPGICPICREWRERSTSKAGALEKVAALGLRFQGVDLMFRREGTDWPKLWRAQCFSAKHGWVRMHAFGDSAEEAIDALLTETNSGDAPRG